MAKTNKLLWIIIIAGAILLLNQGIKKEAALPSGSYVKYSTTALSYGSGTEINHAPNCGDNLLNYDYYNSGGNLAGTCAAKMPTLTSCAGAVLLTENLPGGWRADGTAPSLWAANTISSGIYTYLCVCQDNGVQYNIKKFKYDTTTSQPTDYDPTLSILCNAQGCVEQCACAANTCIGSTCTGNCGGNCPGTKSCTTECTAGQTKCGTQGIDKYQLCMANNQWSGTLTCTSGTYCLGNSCMIPLAALINYKTSYLAGTSIPTFVTNANLWVNI